jgi:hypothetical protein
MVLAHARALLTSSREGATAYLDSDLRDTEKILDQAASTLDFDRPAAIMHYIPDLDDAHEILTRRLEAVPRGCFLAISHAGIDLFPDEIAPFEQRLNELLRDSAHVARPRPVMAELFDGLELLEPGVVRVSEWRPDSAAEAATPTTLWGGVAAKRR